LSIVETRIFEMNMKLFLNALMVFILALFISLSCKADEDRQHSMHVHELYRAVHQGDAQALIEFKAEAEKGDSWAQTMLGNLYSSPDFPSKPNAPDEHRQGFKDILPQDYQEAMKWYQKAAAQGDPTAMAGIGKMYREGLGVPKNTDEALKWDTKAAETGDTQQARALGWKYFNGQDGVKQDYAEAAKYFKIELAKQMDYFTVVDLAEMYKDGKGVQKDPVEAYYWIIKLQRTMGAPLGQKVEGGASPTDQQKIINEVLDLPLTPEEKADVMKRTAPEITTKPHISKSGKLIPSD
jgi:tetratricopeptide (TPR) repeat protein